MWFEKRCGKEDCPFHNKCEKDNRSKKVDEDLIKRLGITQADLDEIRGTGTS
jgi:hypothetical protein